MIDNDKFPLNGPRTDPQEAKPENASHNIGLTKLEFYVFHVD